MTNIKSENEFAEHAESENEFAEPFGNTWVNLSPIYKNLKFREAENLLPKTGWFDLTQKCLEELNELSEKFNSSIEISQIKEKFGELRIYFNLNHNFCEINTKEFINDLYVKIHHIINKYVELSIKTCINCGNNENVYKEKGYWNERLCENCHQIQKVKQQKLEK